MDTWFPTFRRLLGTRLSLPITWLWYTTTAQRRGLLRLLAVGIEEKLPLVPLLETWAADERGVQHFRLLRLIRLLNEGSSLADAVEQVPGVLSDDDILAIRFDAQSGTVSAATREKLGEERIMSQERPSGLRSTLLYAGAVLLMGFPVVVFIQLWVMPKLKEIMNLYNLGGPSTMLWSERLTKLFTSFALLGFCAVLVFLLSMLFARPGRTLRRATGQWFVPPRDRRAADLLRKLAIVINAGRPVAGALSTLARYHFDPAIRHKLLFVRNEVEQGADLWQSMSDVDLIDKPEVRVMDIAERVGNRSWALTQLAYGKQRSAMRYLEGISQFVLPTLVVLMGLFVLFQALAVLVPMTWMIGEMAK